MADSTAFEWLCHELESATSLDRLEARGTVRITLKQAGLNSGSVSADQIPVVLRRVLPGELSSRGIDDAEAICEQLCARTGEIPAPAAGAADTPESVFARLAG